jgi:hypothetical protein
VLRQNKNIFSFLGYLPTTWLSAINYPRMPTTERHRQWELVTPSVTALNSILRTDQAGKRGVRVAGMS